MEIQENSLFTLKIKVIFICEETIIYIRDKKTLRIFNKKLY